ncbi:aliphatic sulfonate ABC transporter substrate-binding protein [Pseudomonas entomophila]|uniref:aliphatic sulfonate ABC transporter substrate-binding protein n=1 Tax=Pseudomonas entomophila TaxID=312306 RepID=UPI0023D84F5E|nr:aliphatic sulfonate ABC transporter substrate-binding protein [Pseudomonas entomophila]MDF0732822.1 aliphatic sulfonate ABC transporter substrate-binding protein [Pseudomonas entomophila]
MIGRFLIALGLGVASALAQAADPQVLRIGYQKSSVNMVLAREHQLLQKALPNTQVQWIEFPGGPQLIEALNGGSLDVGNIGDIPPIFAQAAGIDLRYIGIEPSDGRSEAIIVPRDSPVRQLSDLKGKRVAFQKGSSAHSLLLKSLIKAGMQLSDVQPVFLPAADARPAFEQGKLDAWVIWDPYYAAALLDGSARLLSDGRDVHPSGTYYIASRAFTEQHGSAIAAVLEALRQAQRISVEQPEASIDSMTRVLGLKREVVERFFAHRYNAPIRPLDDAAIDTQQRIADLFFANRLIPRAVTVGEIVYRP